MILKYIYPERGSTSAARPYRVDRGSEIESRLQARNFLMWHMFMVVRVIEVET